MILSLEYLYTILYSGLLQQKNFYRIVIGLRTPRPAYRAPRWPDPEFPQKNTPQAEILELQENTPKIPKKYQKCAFLVFWGYFFGIFGAFWGKFWESRISGWGVFFSVFLVEIPGRVISGLCSRSGCSQSLGSGKSPPSLEKGLPPEGVLT